MVECNNIDTYNLEISTEKALMDELKKILNQEVDSPSFRIFGTRVPEMTGIIIRPVRCSERNVHVYISEEGFKKLVHGELCMSEFIQRTKWYLGFRGTNDHDGCGSGIDDLFYAPCTLSNAREFLAKLEMHREGRELVYTYTDEKFRCENCGKRDCPVRKVCPVKKTASESWSPKSDKRYPFYEALVRKFNRDFPNSDCMIKETTFFRPELPLHSFWDDCSLDFSDIVLIPTLFSPNMVGDRTYWFDCCTNNAVFMELLLNEDSIKDYDKYVERFTFVLTPTYQRREFLMGTTENAKILQEYIHYCDDENIYNWENSHIFGKLRWHSHWDKHKSEFWNWAHKASRQRMKAVRISARNKT